MYKQTIKIGMLEIELVAKFFHIDNVVNTNGEDADNTHVHVDVIMRFCPHTLEFSIDHFLNRNKRLSSYRGGMYSHLPSMVTEALNTHFISSYRTALGYRVSGGNKDILVLTDQFDKFVGEYTTRGKQIFDVYNKPAMLDYSRKGVDNDVRYIDFASLY